ncbi:MAG: threonylcarbamoyl-AMP synthase [Rhizobiaceae bacterium]|nr:threonylcarbamoyl-AMP synthase [Rhizobiaceae bacterium]
MVRLLPSSSDDAVTEALRLLSNGGLVALPTETVYGLGADATDGVAVARIFEAKGRPRFNPLICHVGNLAMALRTACFDGTALALAKAFWPGPMTLVLPSAAASGVHPLVTGGLSTVAVRMPEGVARKLAADLGRPIAAPSANRSGKVSPTTAAHVAASLGARVDLILDGGPSAVGLESTILKPMGDHIALLRAGGLSVAEVEAVSGLPVRRAEPDSGIEAPGQLASHYAPHGSVRLDASAVAPGEWLIRFGATPVEGEEKAGGIIELSRSGDLHEAASRLFAALAACDRPEIAIIAVTPVPEDGLGEAINDRLRRAAAPRS